MLEPATLLKATLLHGWFSRFLNCTDGTKWRKTRLSSSDKIIRKRCKSSAKHLLLISKEVFRNRFLKFQKYHPIFLTLSNNENQKYELPEIKSSRKIWQASAFSTVKAVGRIIKATRTKSPVCLHAFNWSKNFRHCSLRKGFYLSKDYGRILKNQNICWNSFFRRSSQNRLFPKFWKLRSNWF